VIPASDAPNKVRAAHATVFGLVSLAIYKLFRGKEEDKEEEAQTDQE